MQIFADKIFKKPMKVIQAFDNKSFVEAFSQIEELRKQNKYYLLGYIRYEAKEVFIGGKIKSKYPLLYFEVFDSCHCERSEAIQETKYFGLPRRGFASPRNDATIDYQNYSKAIKQIKKEIAEGNTYQVNYTYDYKIETVMDGLNLYKNILPRQTTPYNAYIKNEWEEILCFSPELFFELENNKIRTKPMKGTIKRGKTAQEDLKNIEFLKNDIKNRAENVMIVDLLRNDLGKIAKTGSVKVDKLFEVETHKTLHQMTSEITAELEENTELFDIFKALFPCGSVTGAPKINTMEIIDKLEIGSRDVYCGAIGLISPEETVFCVPIRTLQHKLNENFFTCRVGGAIVWDSTAKDEWDETLTKIKFLEPDFKLVETMLVKDGKIQFEKEHLKRMKDSAKEFGFKFNLKSFKINSKQDGILRVLLSKDGSFEMQEIPLTKIKANKISISKEPLNSKEPMLYHKTTYRPWYDEAMEKIKQGKIFDEIFFNERGELTEGARSNIVLQIDGELFTPPVECGLLNGTLRQKLVNPSPLTPLPQGERGQCSNLRPLREKVAESRMRGKIIEKILYLDDLKNAEKIFCINSVRGVVEVNL